MLCLIFKVCLRFYNYTPQVQIIVKKISKNLSEGCIACPKAK